MRGFVFAISRMVGVIAWVVPCVFVERLPTCRLCTMSGVGVPHGAHPSAMSSVVVWNVARRVRQVALPS